MTNLLGQVQIARQAVADALKIGCEYIEKIQKMIVAESELPYTPQVDQCLYQSEHILEKAQEQVEMLEATQAVFIQIEEVLQEAEPVEFFLVENE